MARNYVRHGMQFLSPEIDTEGYPLRAGTEFPLFSYLLAILYKIFGLHEILGRVLSALFAAWGAAFLYELVRVRMGESVALWSALIVSVIPVHLYFTRTVQPESMALWGLLGFLLYADRWLNRHGTSRDWILAAGLGALGPLLKLPFLYVVLLMWLFLGIERYGWNPWRQKAWIALLGVVIGLTWGWYHYAGTAPVEVLPLSSSEHWTNLKPILTLRLWENQFISRFPELCLTYGGLLFAGLGIFSYRKAKSFPFLLAWLLATVFYVVALGEYGLIHRYTLLPAAPICAVLIACGVSTFWEYAKIHPARKLAFWILIISIPLHAGLRIKHWYRLERGWLFRAREVVAKLSRPQDLILPITTEPPVLLYYIDRYGYAMNLKATASQDIEQRRCQDARFVLVPTDTRWSDYPRWAESLVQRGRLIHRDPEFVLYEVKGALP